MEVTGLPRRGGRWRSPLPYCAATLTPAQSSSFMPWG